MQSAEIFTWLCSQQRYSPDCAVNRDIHLLQLIPFSTLCGSFVYFSLCGSFVYFGLCGSFVYFGLCGSFVYFGLCGSFVYFGLCGSFVYFGLCGSFVYFGLCGSFVYFGLCGSFVCFGLCGSFVYFGLCGCFVYFGLCGSLVYFGLCGSFGCVSLWPVDTNSPQMAWTSTTTSNDSKQYSLIDRGVFTIMVCSDKNIDKPTTTKLKERKRIFLSISFSGVCFFNFHVMTWLPTISVLPLLPSLLFNSPVNIHLQCLILFCSVSVGFKAGVY